MTRRSSPSLTVGGAFLFAPTLDHGMMLRLRLTCHVQSSGQSMKGISVGNNQLALPVLTSAATVARLHEITDSLSHGISELSAPPEVLDTDTADDIYALVTQHIDCLYTVLNDVAPAGWIDPRRQAAADVRALHDVRSSCAHTAKGLDLYLKGRATH